MSQPASPDGTGGNGAISSFIIGLRMRASEEQLKRLGPEDDPRSSNPHACLRARLAAVIQDALYDEEGFDGVFDVSAYIPDPADPDKHIFAVILAVDVGKEDTKDAIMKWLEDCLGNEALSELMGSPSGARFLEASPSSIDFDLVKVLGSRHRMIKLTAELLA